MQSEDVAAAGEDVEEERSDLAASGAAGLASHTAGIARIESGSEIRAGSTARLAVDTGKLYFFDPADGAAIRG